MVNYEKGQIRHEKLVKLLNSFEQYKGSLKVYDETRRTSDSQEYLTINEINNAVVVFTDVLNMASGSAGKIDLYKLLQSYFLDEVKREQINQIIRQ